jgi:hypothetical protein
MDDMTPVFALFYALTIGFNPMQNLYISDQQMELKNTLTVDLVTELRFMDTLYIGGGVKTDMDPSTLSEGGMSPFQAYYTFDAGIMLHVDDVKIRIGVDHECYHPVSSSFSSKTLKVYGGKTTIYVKIGNM